MFPCWAHCRSCQRDASAARQRHGEISHNREASARRRGTGCRSRLSPALPCLRRCDRRAWWTVPGMLERAGHTGRSELQPVPAAIRRRCERAGADMRTMPWQEAYPRRYRCRNAVHRRIAKARPRLQARSQDRPRAFTGAANGGTRPAGVGRTADRPRSPASLAPVDTRLQPGGIARAGIGTGRARQAGGRCAGAHKGDPKPGRNGG